MCICILFLNCEDTHSKKKKKTVTKQTTKEQTTPEKDSISDDTKTYPVLDGLQNAMEFFLEYDKHHKENKVRLTTDFGTIDILLFNETKFHRANFIYLTKRGYFNGTQFYRVINNFIIQGGNSDDKKTAKKRASIGKYLLPTDTNRGYTHERGVLSMPSGEIDNPYKLASPFEFFIVQQHGGAHFLDGDYTVFGKVIDGMDVVDKIAAVKTDEADWPLHNVYIRKAEIIN
ncbi:peptidyl-prolyl cis-trans isomerase [Yeosuana aromativorans]|uniref:Peptidyl-prolyl cis-trans isomerase n=2 Tax=Yeosuana aromativorans TaxID=288019 RepID=A0A8J3BMS0_9FLAO|nr:peptidyl-prolyl cis-trans isomerase [Yeosuana aromativorans]